ncbi:MAG: AAA family ATPase, partial [Planctomycetes bacterium]|nr:AAA family ATPase [Planctomycetota bacterium]
IVGAGKAEGAMDAGNLLKPMLARGELHCIGATTLDEYRKYLEKDSALERRFQPVRVDPPDLEATISILRGLRERFELHHGVRIQDAALVSAATLSDRYISDRFLPDKAIDLVDEAAALVRTEMESLPTELDELNRKIMQREIEQEALKKEKDPASKARLATLRKDLADFKKEAQVLQSQWEKEKATISIIRILKEKIEKARHAMSEAERKYDLERAAAIRYGELPDLAKKLETAENQAVQESENHGLLREEVTEDEVAEIVARWTGIPVARLMEGERLKLLRLDEILHRRVIGQDEGIQAVTDAVLRARSGLKDPKRPVGSFIFLGPTGVGKTELARSLAEALFDTEENMIRIDMSEYMDRHSTSRLIGAPPGYVGYDEGGQLTEAVRRRPYSVILFDEIEKAHPEVFHILLQLLDDGRLTDNQGRVVDFKNTVIIMTSNLGSPLLLEGLTEDGRIKPETREAVLNELHSAFRPEFINRIDEIILFSPLTMEEIVQIVALNLYHLKTRLAERNIQLTHQKAALEYIAGKAYEPVFGARPVKRYLQKQIETVLGRKIIAGEIPDGSRIDMVMNPRGDGIDYTILAPETEPAAGISS